MFIDAFGIHENHLSSKSNSPSIEQINLCEKWILQYAKPKRTFNDYAYSYSLKHRVERDVGEYISNGAFIQAAINLGYKLQTDYPNCCFNMDLLYPEDEWKRIRPTGFSAWLFKQYKHCYLAEDALNDENWPRRAKTFFEFFDYLKYHTHATDELIRLWETWSGEYPPIPDFDLCDAYYNNYEDFDVVCFNEQYDKSPKFETYIYGLIDPRDNRIRYIGQTKNPAKRLKQHILRPGSIEKVAWIGKMLSESIYPEMVILEYANDDVVNEREMILMYSFQEYESKSLLNRITPL